MRPATLTKGQQVRVTIEGRYFEDHDVYLRVLPGLAPIVANVAVSIPHSAVVSIELIEPEYIPGEVYRDANGVVWVYGYDDYQERTWARPGTSLYSPFTTPARPLVRLVPEK